MDDDDEPDLGQVSLDTVIQGFSHGYSVDELFLDVIEDTDYEEEEEEFSESAEQSRSYLGLTMDNDLMNMGLVFNRLKVRGDNYIGDFIQEASDLYNEYEQTPQEPYDTPVDRFSSSLETTKEEDIRDNISDDIKSHIDSVKQVLMGGVGYAKPVYFIRVNPDDM